VSVILGLDFLGLALSRPQVFTASVGDTVTFSWGGARNVFLHPTGTCDAAGATEVGSSSGAVYTFTAAGSFTFACEVGQHCESGQILTFTVT
jgi:plastocyanin